MRVAECCTNFHRGHQRSSELMYLVSIGVDQRRSATWQVTWDAVPNPLQGSMGSDPAERGSPWPARPVRSVCSGRRALDFQEHSTAKLCRCSCGLDRTRSQSQSRLGVIMEVSRSHNSGTYFRVSEYDIMSERVTFR